MIKTYVTVIDTESGASQYNKIEQPIEKGFEIANALGHLGIDINTVEWLFEHSNLYTVKQGQVKGTTKVVNVVMINC